MINDRTTPYVDGDSNIDLLNVEIEVRRETAPAEGMIEEEQPRSKDSK